MGNLRGTSDVNLLGEVFALSRIGRNGLLLVIWKGTKVALDVLAKRPCDIPSQPKHECRVISTTLRDDEKNSRNDEAGNREPPSECD